jgi:diguanylate cyclase (GGDEF)-like protein
MTPALDLAACSASAWQATPDLGLRAVLMVGLLVLAGWAGAQRYFPGQRVFVALHVVMLLWVGTTTAEHAAVAEGCKATLAVLAWPVLLLQPPLWAVFVGRYVHSETGAPSRLAWLAVGLPYLALTAAALSNGWHGRFYGPDSGLGPAVLGLPRMRYDYGPGFVLAAVWGYGWLLAALAVVLQAWHQASAGERSQWTMLLIIMGVPTLANLAYLGLGWRLLGGDPTPLSFAVALAGFAWLIRTDQLFKIVPLARRLLFTDLPDPVLVIDGQGRVMDANAAARQLAGSEPPRALPLAEWPRFGAALAAALASPDHGPLQLAYPTRVLELRVRELGSGARHIGRLVQLRDVTERQATQARLVQTLAERNAQLQQVAALQAELREQALRDPLTGLRNRRALQQAYAAETRRPLALAVVDADHFKRINDSSGHAAGDRVLCALSARLQAGLGPEDTVFRVGGEEFALLLPGIDLATALLRVDTLRAQIGAETLGGAPGPVTVSAGVAERGRHGDTLDDLHAAADAALYAAKTAGRDRVMAAG